MKRRGALEIWTKCWMSSKILPGELHDVHLATRHVKTCLTIAPKHTTNFTSDEGIHPVNCSSKNHHLDCHLKMRNNWENISASLTTDGRRRLHIQRECYKSHTDDFNNDNAICTGRDRGVSGLLVSGVGSVDQDPIHIAEREHVQREGTREGNKHKARA